MRTMQDIAVSSNQHLSRLFVGWALMIPLVFFAINGTIRFDAYSRNNALEASYTSLIKSQSHGLTQVALAAVFAVCAILFCTRLRGVSGIARNNKIFVVLGMLAVVSTAWSQFPQESLQQAIYAAIDVWFAFYLAARFNPSRQMQLFLILGWVVTLSSICAALLFPHYGMDNQGESTLGAWIGIFPHKNWCSIMVAFLLSGAFYMRPSTLALRVARIVYITLSLLVIIMSQSRTGWIVAACLLLYVGVTKHIKRYKAKDRLLVVMLLSGAVVVAGAVATQYYTAIMLLIGKDPTLTGRTMIWKLALNSAMKHPFLGYGYRGFWHGLQGESANVALADNWIVPAAHNGFLDLWLGLGAVGVGLVIYSMLQGARNGITSLRRGPSSSTEWYLCIIFLTIVSNIAELTLMVPDYLAWIMYVLACVGLSQEAKRIRLGMVHA
jgi:exopolysaccharide production protein ExoQ